MPKAKKSKTKKMIAKGGRKTVDTARAKWREAVNHAKAIKKELNAKLKAKTLEFKKKIQEVEAQALATALETLEREIAKKENAKKKVLAQAEAKFEKRYNKKTFPKIKKTPAKQKVKASATKASTLKAGKTTKRGRPAKVKTTAPVEAVA